MQKEHNRDCISISYFEENKDFLELKDEMSCSHSIDRREDASGLLICSGCSEVVKKL